LQLVTRYGWPCAACTSFAAWGVQSKSRSPSGEGETPAEPLRSRSEREKGPPGRARPGISDRCNGQSRMMWTLRLPPNYCVTNPIAPRFSRTHLPKRRVGPLTPCDPDSLCFLTAHVKRPRTAWITFPVAPRRGMEGASPGRAFESKGVWDSRTSYKWDPNPISGEV
jgi:hypothetical protein